MPEIDQCSPDMYKTAIPIPNTIDFATYEPEREFSKKSLAYKKVANQIKPVATTLPEEFRIVRKIPGDLLAEMPILPTKPPEFKPGIRYTAERKNKMPVNLYGFLWPEEEKLAHYIIRVHETAFALVFVSPVSRPEKDRKKTGPRPPKTENLRTGKDRDCGLGLRSIRI